MRERSPDLEILFGKIKQIILDDEESEVNENLQPPYWAKFDIAGKLISESFEYDHQRALYLYDAQNRLAKKLIFNPDENFDSNKELLDPENDLQELLLSIEIYKYDEAGRKFESFDYDCNGKLSFQRLGYLDGRGNLIQNSLFLANGTLISTIYWSYDEANRPIELKHIDNPEKQTTADYLIFRFTFHYDATGHLIEKNDYYGEDDSHTYKSIYSYECDEIGNWIKRYDKSSNFITGDEENNFCPRRLIYW